MTNADLAPFGVAVGHATDLANATGLTVARGVDGPLRGGAAVLGCATGTRELALLDPAHMVDAGGESVGNAVPGAISRIAACTPVPTLSPPARFLRCARDRHRGTTPCSPPRGSLSAPPPRHA